MITLSLIFKIISIFIAVLCLILIDIDNREYKQEFYFKNPEYIKHLNLNSNE